jgi:DNA ligase (NAD+)
LSAISIPLIGKTYARELALTFGDYESFRDEIINYFDFESLEGFGPAMHDAIVNFDYTEADMMVERYIIDFVEEDSALEKSGNALEGAVVVITGKLHNFKNRDELKAIIERAGGKVTGSVSSKTTYLVNNDTNSTSSKNKTAQSLGVKIISEEELLNMLN